MKQSKIRGLFATSHRHADVQPFPVKQHPEQLLGVTNAITPSIPPSSSSPRAFLAEHSAIWCRSCLWSAGLAGAQLLVHPQLHGCGGQRGKRRKKKKQKALILCKHCSAIAKRLACYQHWNGSRARVFLHCGCLQLAKINPTLRFGVPDTSVFLPGKLSTF